MDLFVNFDDLTWPLTNNVVMVTASEGPVEGMGITWAEIEGEVAATIEFKMRGQEPVHISLRQEEDGSFEIILPELKLYPTPQED